MLSKSIVTLFVRNPISRISREEIAKKSADLATKKMSMTFSLNDTLIHTSTDKEMADNYKQLTKSVNNPTYG